MGEITTTEWKCDRCGHVSKSENDVRGGRSGYLNISWGGGCASMGMDGGWGGISIDGRAWLCMDCTEKFQKFMKEDD